MKRLAPTVIVLAVVAALGALYGGFVMNEQNGWSGDLLLLFTEIEAPATLVHALIGLPILVLLGILLLRQRILLLPQQTFTLALIGFGALLGLSVPFAVSRSLAITQWAEFLVAIAGLFAVVGSLGRREGPKLLLGSLSAAGAVVAARGILEYAAMRRDDPSWRIFAGWVNPNATVAILAVCLFCALGLMLSSERLPRLLLSLAAGLMLFAAALTGSKGGLALAIPVSLVAFGMISSPFENRALLLHRGVGVLLLLVIGGLFLRDLGTLSLLLTVAYVAVGLARLEDKPVGVWLTPFALGGLLVFGLTLSPPTPAKQGGSPPAVASPIQRVVKSEGNKDQSVTFRLNLWKSAISLAKEKPLFGFGLGSFRTVSARPGITTGTLYAHSSYLQLAAEAGLLSLAAYVILLGLWLRAILKGIDRIPVASRLQLGGVVAAVTFLSVHGLVDSDLYYFGLSLTLFLLMGVGLLLAADAVAPEYISPSFRTGGFSALAVTLVLVVVAGQLDALKSRARGAGIAIAQSSDPQAAQRDYQTAVEALKPWSRVDAEAAFLYANVLTGSERLAMQRQALTLTPTPRIARRIAKDLMESGEFLPAADVLATGMIYDPKNLPARLLKIRCYQAYGDLERAAADVRALLEIEKSPYYSIRSLSEVIPTETLEARFLDVDQSLSKAAKADRLADGVRGMKRYHDITGAILKAQNQNGNRFALGDEDLPRATTKIAAATEAATKAETLYRELGKTAEAEEMREAAALFRSF